MDAFEKRGVCARNGYYILFLPHCDQRGLETINSLVSQLECKKIT